MTSMQLDTVTQGHAQPHAQEAGLFVFRAERHGPSTRHDHLFHEIVYVESGSADHDTADGVQKLRPGDIIIIRPRIWHAYLRPSNLCIYNCLFDQRWLGRFGAMLAECDGAFELFRRRPRNPEVEAPTIVHASPSRRAIIEERLRTIIEEQRDRQTGWQATTSAALLDLLVNVARLRQPSKPPEHPVSTDRTAQAVLDCVSYIESHFTSNVRLDTLAMRVHMSPGHLSRHFNQRMGMGVIDFMHRLRIEEACRQLAWTEQSVGEVAGRVGYDELAYFSRRFKRETGHSPSDYRKRRQHRDA